MLTTRERGTYLTINAEGRFTQKVDASTVGAKARFNEETGKTYHEMFFDNLEGYLSDLNVKDGTYGVEYQLIFTDGEDRVILTLGYGSNYLKPFLKMLPNVDLSQMINLSPSAKMEDGVKKTSLFMKQNDKLVPYAFKTGDGMLPERALIKVKGKDTWDYSAQMDFLTAKAMEKMGSHVVSAPAQEATLDDI